MLIIVMKKSSSVEAVDRVLNLVREHEFVSHIINTNGKTVIGVTGEDTARVTERFQVLEAVEKVLPLSKPFKLVSREWKRENTLVSVGKVVFGGRKLVVIAGPCSVESEAQMLTIAERVKSAGGSMLRGGAYKPRTSPYSFQGLGEKGLQILARVREKSGLPIVTEVMSVEQLPLVSEYADVLQIGARNIQNFPLLQEVGKSKLPVILKRGMMTTIEEYLVSAEYILLNGNENVVLCERGIRTFETATRNILDIAAFEIIKGLSHLPIIADPSHAVGKRSLVPAMARAAVAAGADGLLVEVHHAPEDALSDGVQAILPDELDQLVKQTRQIAAVMGKTL